MKIIGLDYGERKIGIAVGDSESRVATPLMTMRAANRAAAVREIVALCRQEQIQHVVIGLPVNPQAQSQEPLERIRRFGADIAAGAQLPVSYTDERFTTQYAQQLAGRDRDDEVAAMLIVQSYLDSLV